MYSLCNTCQPAVEVEENKDNYIVTMELPGSTRDDIRVWQEKNILTISGEKKAPEGNKIWNERLFGKFERTFKLPDDANRDNIEANYADGVIRVEIPKMEQAKPKDIEIN